MFGHGYLLAVSDEEVGAFLGCPDAAARHRWVEEVLAAGYIERRAELDKAWPAIHRCLAAAPRAGVADPALAVAVLGGDPAAAERHAALVPREAVPAVAAALAKLDEEELRARFFATLPRTPDGESDELDFLYTLQWFENLRELYGRATREGLGVLFVVREPGTAWSLARAAVLDRWIF